jgi:hypothetical protein
MKLPWRRKNIQIPPPRLTPGAGFPPPATEPDLHGLPAGPKQPPDIAGGHVIHPPGLNQHGPEPHDLGFNAQPPGPLNPHMHPLPPVHPIPVPGPGDPDLHPLGVAPIGASGSGGGTNTMFTPPPADGGDKGKRYDLGFNGGPPGPPRPPADRGLPAAGGASDTAVSGASGSGGGTNTMFTPPPTGSGGNDKPHDLGFNALPPNTTGSGGPGSSGEMPYPDGTAGTTFSSQQDDKPMPVGQGGPIPANAVNQPFIDKPGVEPNPAYTTGEHQDLHALGHGSHGLGGGITDPLAKKIKVDHIPESPLAGLGGPANNQDRNI